MTGDDSGLSVLVVDDDAAILRTLLLTLKSLGCRVVGESGGEAALAAVEKQAPDLLLTDMRMEGMSGVELTAAALERRPDLVCPSPFPPESWSICCAGSGIWCACGVKTPV